MFTLISCTERGMKALSECSVKNRGGGSLATVEDAGWPVDMCGFEDVVNCRLLSAFRLIERSKVDFGLLERYTASRCRKQPLHDVANRITDQPGTRSLRVSSLLSLVDNGVSRPGAR